MDNTGFQNIDKLPLGKLLQNTGNVKKKPAGRVKKLREKGYK